MTPTKLKDLPVTELMIPAQNLVSTDSVAKAVGFLRNENLYEAFIEEEDRTAIIAIRDVLSLKYTSATRLSNLMYPVPRLNPNNTVGDAAALMFEHRIRSLPIYESGKLKGQITSPNIVQRLLESDTGVRAAKIMTPDPICLDATDEISKARRVMMRRKIDQLPILKEGKFHNVISSDAIVFNMMPTSTRNLKGDWQTGRLEVPVGVFASKWQPTTNDLQDTILDVYKNMSNNRTNYSVVMNIEQGEVQGIITYRDFMKLLKSEKKGEPIPMYIVGLPEDPFEAGAARQKFTTVIELLKRGFPEITEARAIIKAGETKSPRKKYQVKIFINSPYGHYSYKVFGYELPDTFDYVNAWAKKLISNYQTRRQRTRSDKGLIP